MGPDDSFDNPRTSSPAPVRPEIRSRLLALAERHPGLVLPEAPLAPWTTLRIGGPALALCRCRNPQQLTEFLEFADRSGLPTFFLGGGSNLLVDDRGFAGLVLRLELSGYRVEDDLVTAGAGLPLDELVRRTLADGLVGLEFASGVPGTVGGAVTGNAGCYGHAIGERVVDVELLHRDGSRRKLTAAELEFGYRRSRLQRLDAIVLSVTLRLERTGDTRPALRERERHLADRGRKHPVRLPCAGSWFRNLPPATPGGRRRPAGALLEAVGAKRLRRGDAGVYHKHANIIVNHGRARAVDVLRLAAAMRAAVYARFGVELQEEVRFLPWHGGHLTFSG